MKNILVVFGTRPEAVKLCPLINELKSRRGFETRVLVTGQHREMLDSVLDIFGVTPDVSLGVMREGQSLTALTARILMRLEGALKSLPDVIIVHGDTATSFAASLFGFFGRIPVCHVEAGLRTYDLTEPFPEEFNRRAVALATALHFAPTKRAMDNLLGEGIPQERIFVTGNTAIDALSYTLKNDFSHPALSWAGKNKIIFLTAHRRENWGEPTENIFKAVTSLLDNRSGLRVVYPVHPNPKVRETALRYFSRRKVSGREGATANRSARQCLC